MWMRKGIQYTLVILGLLSATATHAMGEGTGLLRGCKINQVTMGERASCGASTYITGEGCRRKIGAKVEGPIANMFFMVEVTCHQAISTPVNFTQWDPRGTRNTRTVALKSGRNHIDGRDFMTVHIGQYGFEISTQPQQRGGQRGNVESKMSGGIRLEPDPTPCPRNIKAPHVIRYGG